MKRQAATIFRPAGLRATPQRIATLQVLDGSDRPLSAEEILSRMRDFRSGVPTIYRNLHLFAAHGWVEPVLGKDKTLRFIRCHTSDHHHHIQCDRCGRMVEVDACGFPASLADFAERSGFRITRHQLQMSGLCPECQSRF